MVLFLTISWLAKRAKLADLKMLLAEGEKITPKAWRVEREQLEKEVPTLLNGRARVCSSENQNFFALKKQINTDISGCSW